jgi:putative transposase
MRTNQPGHLKSFDYIGLHRYLLTFCTDYRQRFFVDRANVELVLLQISRAAAETQIAVLAYCFMPDHVHLLTEGETATSDCLAFIKKAKQYSGFYFSKTRGQKLWQRYGYERIVRDDETTLHMTRYVLNNPVRAGLVADVRDYPFLGSMKYSLEQMLDGAMDPRSA